MKALMLLKHTQQQLITKLASQFAPDFESDIQRYLQTDQKSSTIGSSSFYSSSNYKKQTIDQSRKPSHLSKGSEGKLLRISQQDEADLTRSISDQVIPGPMR
jgi:hypothetical protein